MTVPRALAGLLLGSGVQRHEVREAIVLQPRGHIQLSRPSSANWNEIYGRKGEKAT